MASRIARTWSADLGRLENDGDVDVADFVSALGDDRGGALEQVEARRAFPLWIGIGEMTADVAQSRGAEDGIGDRVAGDVGV